MIATSTTDFSIIREWDEISKKLNVPYFNLVCAGLFSYVYISLGSNYVYKEINKADNTVSKIWTIPSLTLDEALEWQKAEKNKEFIASIYGIY